MASEIPSGEDLPEESDSVTVDWEGLFKNARLMLKKHRLREASLFSELDQASAIVDHSVTSAVILPAIAFNISRSNAISKLQ